jgi:hypothetical protein
MIFDRSLLPQQQQVTSRGGGGGQSGFKSPIPGEDYFGIPDSPEGLQYTGHLAKSSSDLFKKRQDLVNYAKTLWTRDKIDVTNPDPSRPEAVMAAEIYKMEIGNFLAQVDKAKQGAKIYNDLLQRQAANKFQLDPNTTQQYASELPYGEGGLGYTKEIDPLLEFSKDGVNRTVETSRDYNRLKGVAQGLQDIYADPTTPEGAIQSAAAQSLSPTLNIPAPSSDSGGSGTVSVGNFVERLINHKAGGGNWQVSKSFTKGGEAWVESTDYQGTNLGKRTVKTEYAKGNVKELDTEAVVEKTVRNPQTGETYLVFTNKSIPDQRIDNISSNQLLEMVSRDNKKYPSIDKINKFLVEKGAVDPDGNVRDNLFIADKTVKTREKTDKEASSAAFTTSDVVSKIESAPDWKLFNPSTWGNDRSVEFNSPSYGPVKFKWIDNNTVEFSNAKGDVRTLTKAQLPQYVRMLGLDSQIEQQPLGNEFEYDGDKYTLDELKSVLSEDQIKKFIVTGTIKAK